jgi:4-amino-4-deoxy-L-arabinose transferase-like glycosyltransferase
MVYAHVCDPVNADSLDLDRFQPLSDSPAVAARYSPTPATPRDSGRRGRRERARLKAQFATRGRVGSFGVRLGLIVALGVTLRVIHAVAIAPATGGINDSLFYWTVSHALAHGQGFVFGYFYTPVPTAWHPPMYPLVLALGLKLGLASDEAQRAGLGSLLGGITILALGLTARRIGGNRMGLWAAGIAAVYPFLIAADGALMSETLYAALLALTILAAYCLIDAPSSWRALVLGVAVGLAALTRPEALLLVPLLAIPVAWRGKGNRLLRVALVCAGAALIVTPWVVRNTVDFGQPTIANDDSTTLAEANCHRAYYGPQVGDAVIACLTNGSRSEAKLAAQHRRQGLDYAESHVSRLPVVALVRLLRAWSFYQPVHGLHGAEGRSLHVQEAGLAMYYPLFALAVAGVNLLRRRRQPLVILVAPIIMVSLVAITAVGTVRLRVAAELSLVLLSAVTVAQLEGMYRASRHRRP